MYGMGAPEEPVQPPEYIKIYGTERGADQVAQRRQVGDSHYREQQYLIWPASGGRHECDPVLITHHDPASMGQFARHQIIEEVAAGARAVGPCPCQQPTGSWRHERERIHLAMWVVQGNADRLAPVLAPSTPTPAPHQRGSRRRDRLTTSPRIVKRAISKYQARGPNINRRSYKGHPQHPHPADP